MNYVREMAIAGVFALAATGASAATCTGNWQAGPKLQETTFTVVQNIPDGASVLDQFCVTTEDNIGENDSEATVAGLFDVNVWTLADKNDGPDGSGALTFGTSPVNKTFSGLWTINNPLLYSSVMLVLKAGQTFGAFELTATDFMGGTWSTSRDLSHASIYYGGQPAPAPVPLPASALLLLGGIGGFAALRRRKKV